ncbi:uncharacterized protein LOC119995543 [Tripterygium wilfordii]|uniref:uncharacterized protein LOC119995543 n=1 Tax=Tripterygium wilfordii TaxID=458696 RepID=UPI0018F808CA|nr:uncharacterized protein LOC119995543 [Tripterygium wilfordii]
MDVIGKILPLSNEGHHFIIVATNYFTKRVEAFPLKFVTQQDMIKVIKESIIHRFGLSHNIMTDQGTVFFGDPVQAFALTYGFEISHSTPNYAQGNGQAKSTNKVLKNIIERMVENRPRAWHEALSEALWAYMTSKRTAIRATPFMLTYGYDIVLSM